MYLDVSMLNIVFLSSLLYLTAFRPLYDSVLYTAIPFLCFDISLTVTYRARKISKRKGPSLPQSLCRVTDAGYFTINVSSMRCIFHQKD